MKRREFIAALGSTPAWPLAARAQRPQRLRRIGVLMASAESDSEELSSVAAFVQQLHELGWADGQNVRIDYRWAGGNASRAESYAADLVGFAPDAILAQSAMVLKALQQTT